VRPRALVLGRRSLRPRTAFPAAGRFNALPRLALHGEKCRCHPVYVVNGVVDMRRRMQFAGQAGPRSGNGPRLTRSDPGDDLNRAGVTRASPHRTAHGPPVACNVQRSLGTERKNLPFGLGRDRNRSTKVVLNERLAQPEDRGID
jgi:hypothetical protein